GSVPLAAWLLFLSTILWTTAYDTMYAMVDRKHDLKIGVKSTAILFGSNDKIIIGSLQLAALTLLAIAGVYLQLGTLYYSGLFIAGCFAVYQQVLIKSRVEKQCFNAFLNNNWFGMAVFTGLFFHYLID
ncbi:MAG: UbiA family prenyltransferase, partial [Gammaproteobacteria bacterium]|nr:UbiA family prenyltransferase [Gammaproteobacteria bacterium]